MILTHDRLDCLRLCLEMLEGRGVRQIDRVAVVERRAAWPRFVEPSWPPDPKWTGTTSRRWHPAARTSPMPEQCVRRYPIPSTQLLTRISSCPAVGPNMLETHGAFPPQRPALITALIPTMPSLHRLLNVFYPEKLPDFERRLARSPDVPKRRGTAPSRNGPAASSWISRPRTRTAPPAGGQRAALLYEFCKYFSIGCICMITPMSSGWAGAPARDEPEWCAWFEANRQAAWWTKAAGAAHAFLSSRSGSPVSVAEDSAGQPAGHLPRRLPRCAGGGCPGTLNRDGGWA